MNIVFELDFYVLKAGESRDWDLFDSMLQMNSIIQSTEKATKQMQRAETMLYFVVFWHTVFVLTSDILVKQMIWMAFEMNIQYCKLRTT